MTGPAKRALVYTALAALVACGDPPEFEGTYEEATRIPDGRDYAYKLDLFRFGDEVGGIVRFYGLGGFNTRDAPFLQPTACAYFGEVDLVGGSVAFTVPDGPEGETFGFLLSSLDPNDIDAEVERMGESGPIRERFDMDRVETVADADCTAPNAFEVTARLPALAVSQAPALSLALVYAGFQREQGLPVVSRVVSTVTPVASDDGIYATSQVVTLPFDPPSTGLSDSDDQFTRYGVAYVVLFDDGNRDGAIAVDEVRALAPTQAVIYVARSGGLPPSVSDVFRTQPEPGHRLYEVDVDVRGSDALITEAVAVQQDTPVVLVPLGADDPVAFPVLLP